MRSSCRKTKTEKTKCEHYNYSLMRCELGRVPANCPINKKVKSNNKHDREVREFYEMDFSKGC